MKQLIYKIVKIEEPNPELKVTFDEDAFVAELKKDLGLTGVSDEELKDHTVQLNSPTGRSSSFKLSADVYIKNEVEHRKQAIEEYNASCDEPREVIDINTIIVDEKNEQSIRTAIENSDDFLEWVEQKPELVEVKQEPQKVENFVYFDVRIPSKGSYIVVIYTKIRPTGDAEADAQEQANIDTQINTVETHFCTHGRIDRNMLLGNEVTISYYTWVNLVSDLEKPRSWKHIENFDNIDAYTLIQDRMNMIFEGGPKKPAGFMF